MPRKNPIPTQLQTVATTMRKLRGTLRMNRVQFAALLGVDSGRIVRLEKARAPWRDEDLKEARTRIEAHLRRGLDSLAGVRWNARISDAPTETSR